MASRMLVVEDNQAVVDFFRVTFEKSGYELVVVDSEEPAKRVFASDPFDLVILDVGLKEGSGYAVCRSIREHSSRASTPVIMLTALSDPQEKAEGFASGADIYLTKPIDVSELTLWTKALLRRAAGDFTSQSIIRAGTLSINADTRTVECAGSLLRGLTSKEFNLLSELARARPNTIRREELEKRVWGEGLRTNTLDVHVKNLRQKLGPQGASHIVTVKGVGYRFE